MICRERLTQMVHFRYNKSTVFKNNLMPRQRFQSAWQRWVPGGSPEMLRLRELHHHKLCKIPQLLPGFGMQTSLHSAPAAFRFCFENSCRCCRHAEVILNQAKSASGEVFLLGVIGDRETAGTLQSGVHPGKVRRATRSSRRTLRSEGRISRLRVAHLRPRLGFKADG